MKPRKYGAREDCWKCGVVLLGYYSCMDEYRRNRVAAGLSGNGCCGHGEQGGWIGLYPEDYEAALALGFKPYVFQHEPERRDSVVPKTRCHRERSRQP